MLVRKARTAAVVCAVSLAMVLLAMSRLGAITYGWLDGTRHPNVGVLIVGLQDQSAFRLCSGTLIAPTVFLTASHCTAYIDFLERQGLVAWVGVSFQTGPSHLQSLYYGTRHTNPAYPGHGIDAGDVAVIEFNGAVAGITPARLPSAGMFDAWYGATRRAVKDLKFTAVGYGSLEPSMGGGPPIFPSSGGWRSFAFSEFGAMDKVWLHLQANQATGDGGTCYGDSGGPNFLWQDGQETDIVAGVTVKGDAMCLATNVVYRLDIPGARAFLEQFVELP